jgi:hypothetical protein
MGEKVDGGPRILVTGDRNWRCCYVAKRLVERLVARYGPGIVIVHGDARGVDQAVSMACMDLGVAQERHPAIWGRHGDAAGPIRNAEMVEAGAILCVAVHQMLCVGRGTKDCARRAIAAGIPTWHVAGASLPPRRLRADDPDLA